MCVIGRGEGREERGGGRELLRCVKALRKKKSGQIYTFGNL